MDFHDDQNRGKDCLLYTSTILGLGPSGLVCTQYARTLGFSKVYGLDLYENRRKLALGLGADAVLNPADPDFPAAMAELPRADVALDMMGDDRLQMCIRDR